MSERVDHVANAAKMLAVSIQAKTGQEETACLAEAQVHATLAVVEQLRVANLIAYLNADVLGGGAGSSGAIADVEAALGIGVDDE